MTKFMIFQRVLKRILHAYNILQCKVNRHICFESTGGYTDGHLGIVRILSGSKRIARSFCIILVLFWFSLPFEKIVSALILRNIFICVKALEEQNLIILFWPYLIWSLDFMENFLLFLKIQLQFVFIH